MKNAAAIASALLLACSAIATAQTPADCKKPEHRQFDFWLGEWDVMDSTGTKRMGRNSISSILKDCVLHEVWVDADGGRGESLNAYDEATHRWHQTWMDDAGNVWKTDGGLVNGQMVLSRAAPALRNAAILVQHRWTWSKLDGNHVRQLYEFSRDSGKTWTVAFDGRYVRTK
jgi:hypothetical protein